MSVGPSMNCLDLQYANPLSRESVLAGGVNTVYGSTSALKKAVDLDSPETSEGRSRARRTHWCTFDSGLKVATLATNVVDFTTNHTDWET